MTAQVPEVLLYRGIERQLLTCPLGQYFERVGSQPRFQFQHTALWRAYIGTWELVDDRLYLVSIDAKLLDGSPVFVSSIFPKTFGKVFAAWYTGELRVPDGPLLEYEHSGFSSSFTRELILGIEKGFLVSERHRSSIID